MHCAHTIILKSRSSVNSSDLAGLPHFLHFTVIAFIEKTYSLPAYINFFNCVNRPSKVGSISGSQQQVFFDSIMSVFEQKIPPDDKNHRLFCFIIQLADDQERNIKLRMIKT